MFLFCCWKHSGAPQSPDCWSPCNVRGNTVEGEMEDGRGMVIEVESMVWLRNLGGRQMFRFTMADIFFCVVVRIMGVVFFGEGSLLMMDLECSGLSFGCLEVISLSWLGILWCRWWKRKWKGRSRIVSGVS